VSTITGIRDVPASTFGLTAALMKGMTTYFSQGGFGAIFTSWQLYAMVASGALGMFLVQSALNAGSSSPPSLTSPCPTRSSRSCGACSRFTKGCTAGRSTC
jgi:hypothetical protein